MTTPAALTPARAPTPRSKPTSSAAPTSSIANASAAGPSVSAPATTPASASAAASTPAPAFSPLPPPPGPRKPQARPATIDPLSDRATENLIRRTLCPRQPLAGNSDPHPIQDLLPPLTSRNDVDLQLYAFLAIILREFVQAWYAKITNDETLVAEILHVIAHCTRALETRFRDIDLQSLLLDEIPDLIDRHITAYRTASLPNVSPPLESEPRAVYHALWPLPALSPVPDPGAPSTIEQQKENEALYRQLLSQAVLSILLPTEDLENPCLTALVEQIFAELILGNVIANKASQPWLLLEAICILSRVVQDKRRAKPIPVSRDSNVKAGGGQPAWSLHRLLVSLISLLTLMVSSIRVCLATLIASSSLPKRQRHVQPLATGKDLKSGPESVRVHEFRHYDRPLVPLLDFRFWSCMSNLIGLSLRMPWVNGLLSLLQYVAIHGPGRVAGVDGSLDRILAYQVGSALNPLHLPGVLRNLRGILFPNNAPGTTSLFAPSSEDELRALRRRAATSLGGLLPQTVGRLYFGGRLSRQTAAEAGAHAGAGEKRRDDDDHDVIVDGIEALLMILSDEYCNKHLMYGILELVMVRLLPELAEKGVVELMDERLG